MRLIDADALMAEFAEFVRPSNNSDFAPVPTWNDAVSLLGSAPTIEERKKGKWIDDAETFYKAVNEKGGGVNEDTPYFVDDIACSECLSLFSVIDNCTEKFDFCPNCGADMRGET